MANDGTSIRVVVIEKDNKEEEKIIQKIETRLQAALGGNYYITYNGGLSWTFRRRPEFITITGEIKGW
jgi:hypothetical protein